MYRHLCPHPRRQVRHPFAPSGTQPAGELRGRPRLTPHPYTPPATTPRGPAYLSGGSPACAPPPTSTLAHTPSKKSPSPLRLGSSPVRFSAPAHRWPGAPDSSITTRHQRKRNAESDPGRRTRMRQPVGTLSSTAGKNRIRTPPTSVTWASRIHTDALAGH